MAATDRAFNAIIERCRLALPLRFRYSTKSQVEPLLEAETRLVQHLGFEQALIEIVESCDTLRSASKHFHAVGAGGSSLILFLLGISDVDPVRCHTHFQRLWTTSNSEPPRLQLVVLAENELERQDVFRTSRISLHAMTAAEAVPELLQRRLPGVAVPMNDAAVYSAMQNGDTDGVFQLDSATARSLLMQIRPSRIQSLAIVTALDVISHTHPDIVREFTDALQERTQARTGERTLKRSETSAFPILFQETIMERFRREAKVPWDETYRLVQKAARGTGKMLGASGEVLERLCEASQWAVCRAHHVANAITSYRAAFYRTFHRNQFEEVLEQVSAWEVTT